MLQCYRFFLANNCAAINVGPLCSKMIIGSLKTWCMQTKRWYFLVASRCNNVYLHYICYMRFMIIARMQIKREYYLIGSNTRISMPSMVDNEPSLSGITPFQFAKSSKFDSQWELNLGNITKKYVCVNLIIKKNVIHGRRGDNG